MSGGAAAGAAPAACPGTPPHLGHFSRSGLREPCQQLGRLRGGVWRGGAGEQRGPRAAAIGSSPLAARRAHRQAGVLANLLCDGCRRRRDGRARRRRARRSRRRRRRRRKVAAAIVRGGGRHGRRRRLAARARSARASGGGQRCIPLGEQLAQAQALLLKEHAALVLDVRDVEGLWGCGRRGGCGSRRGGRAAAPPRHASTRARAAAPEKPPIICNARAARGRTSRASTRRSSVRRRETSSAAPLGPAARARSWAATRARVSPARELARQSSNGRSSIGRAQRRRERRSRSGGTRARRTYNSRC